MKAEDGGDIALGVEFADAVGVSIGDVEIALGIDKTGHGEEEGGLEGRAIADFLASCACNGGDLSALELTDTAVIGVHDIDLALISGGDPLG